MAEHPSFRFSLSPPHPALQTANTAHAVPTCTLPPPALTFAREGCFAGTAARTDDAPGASPLARKATQSTAATHPTAATCRAARLRVKGFLGRSLKNTAQFLCFTSLPPFHAFHSNCMCTGRWHLPAQVNPGTTQRGFSYGRTCRSRVSENCRAGERGAHSATGNGKTVGGGGGSGDDDGNGLAGKGPVSVGATSKVGREKPG